MEYSWIDTESLPCLKPGERIILFGGGQGTVELLHYLAENKMALEILGVVDNDPTMWGKTLQGIPILSPQNIPSIPWDRIIVTTVSGREAVALQLESMGYEEHVHFCRIGTYPFLSMSNVLTLLDLHAVHPFLHRGDRVLHIGPGGFLGTEVALYCLGYLPLSMDAYSFAVQYPDVTSRLAQYSNVLNSILRMPQAALVGEDMIRARYAELLTVQEDGRAVLNTERLPYIMPARYSTMPLPDASLDVVCSFAVLEHVRHPALALRQTARVLKPGGFAAHRILTRDHRSFSTLEGYHPFSYLNESQEGWEDITKDKFYQNRVLPAEWKALFESNGFDVLHYKELETYRLSSAQIAGLHSDFKTPDGMLPERFSGAVNCDILARKRP